MDGSESAVTIRSLLKPFLVGVLGWAIPGGVTLILFVGNDEPVGGANMIAGGALWLLALGPPGCAVAGWLTARTGSGPERFWSGLAGVFTAYGAIIAVDDMVRVVSLGSGIPLLGIPLFLGYGIGAAIGAFIRRAKRSSGGTVAWFRQHPTGRRNALLLVAAIVAVPPMLVTASHLIRSDPSRAEAVLTRLTVPDGWELMASEVDRPLLKTSTLTHYYLARGDLKSVTGQARAMLVAAGFRTEFLGECPPSDKRTPPSAPRCSLLAGLPGGDLQQYLSVYDRHGGALITDAPWFAASSDDKMLVLVRVIY